MRKRALAAVGVVIALVGLLWTLQGIGAIGGSAMSGSTMWAVIGPIVAIAGIVLAVLSLRSGSRRSSSDSVAEDVPAARH